MGPKFGKDLKIVSSIINNLKSTEIEKIENEKALVLENNIEILLEDIEIYFEQGIGETHARFSPVAAAGYEISDNIIKFRFESINKEHPLALLRRALLAISNRLKNSKSQIENMR